MEGCGGHYLSKWIKFVPIDPTGKTSRWQVATTDESSVLGSVHWFGRWRQYAFFPLPDTVYERQCLRDIAEFCEQKTAEWRRDGKH